MTAKGLRASPFLEPKVSLGRLLGEAETGILLNEHIAEVAQPSLRTLVSLVLGIVSKKVDSTYPSRRRPF